MRHSSSSSTLSSLIAVIQGDVEFGAGLIAIGKSAADFAGQNGLVGIGVNRQDLPTIKESACSTSRAIPSKVFAPLLILKAFSSTRGGIEIRMSLSHRQIPRFSADGAALQLLAVLCAANERVGSSVMALRRDFRIPQMALLGDEFVGPVVAFQSIRAKLFAVLNIVGVAYWSDIADDVSAEFMAIFFKRVFDFAVFRAGKEMMSIGA